MTIGDRLATAGLPSLPRKAWIEVDESSLQANLGVFREIVGTDVALNAVVKADGYGHGLIPAGRAFEAVGAARLCVASFDEAVALRDAGIRIAILVMFAAPLAEVLDEAVARAIELTLSAQVDERELIEALDRRPGDPGGALGVHVEVDTGLTRGGLLPDGVASAIRTMEEIPAIRIAGLWTHMATPEDAAYTAMQVATFDRVVEQVGAAARAVPPRHAAATGGVLTGRVPPYEGVRIGLGLYGLVPTDLPMPREIQPAAARLRPAVVLKCYALRLEQFPAGTRVSYGGLWTAQRDSWIATLPVGYGDGIPRSAPWGQALVRGRRVPLVGSVAMDAVMADVTDVMADGQIAPDEEFVLLGPQGQDELAADELARTRNTIPWEIVTSLSYRLPRVYHAGSVLLSIRTLNGETRVSANRLSKGVDGDH